VYLISSNYLTLGAQRLVGLVIDASEEMFWLIHSTLWSSLKAVLAVKEYRACSQLYAAILNIFLCEYPHFTKHKSQTRGYVYKNADSTLQRLSDFLGHNKEHTTHEHTLCHLFQIHAFSSTQDIC
jgi:hypothetical protein